jgi:hypothetical protein
VIRLELDSEYLDYYAEIDAVKLVGQRGPAEQARVVRAADGSIMTANELLYHQLSGPLLVAAAHATQPGARALQAPAAGEAAGARRPAGAPKAPKIPAPGAAAYRLISHSRQSSGSKLVPMVGSPPTAAAAAAAAAATAAAAAAALLLQGQYGTGGGDAGPAAAAGGAAGAGGGAHALLQGQASTWGTDSDSASAHDSDGDCHVGARGECDSGNGGDGAADDTIIDVTVRYEKTGPIGALPDELLLDILELFPTHKLLQIARVCRWFYWAVNWVVRHRDGMDLQPCYDFVTDSALEYLAPKMNAVDSLNLFVVPPPPIHTHTLRIHAFPSSSFRSPTS